MKFEPEIEGPDTVLSSHSETMLSFVVIAYNEEARITRAIMSIGELGGLHDYEIIVVDDGSMDATSKVVTDVANLDDRVRLLALESNRGRGAARAAGVQAARGQYIAMVDADIVLPWDWWIQCKQALTAYDVVSGIAVPDGDVAYLSGRMRLEPKPAPATTAVTGNNAVFRREVFDQVAYDESLRNGEDVALSYAMRDCGLRTSVVPGLTVEHCEGKTLLQSISWLFESGVGASRQLEKYHEIRRPDQAAALLIGLLVNVLIPRGKNRAMRFWYLAAVLLVIAALHVHTKFVFDRKSPIRYAAGVLIDALLISSYACGRLVGHGYICRRMGQ